MFYKLIKSKVSESRKAIRKSGVVELNPQCLPIAKDNRRLVGGGEGYPTMTMIG